MAIAPTMMLYPNYPFFMSAFGSDDNDESGDQFDFNISRELLLNPKNIMLGEMIGEGSNSIVYQGLFKGAIAVAVKIVQPSKTSAVSIQHKQQFQKEVLLLSSMRHLNIVRFLGAVIEPQLMIVTELVEGGTLQRFMLNSRPSPLDLKTSLTFALDISRAMEYLHSKGIIHRDLNPRNVLVTGDMQRVMLADFGLAREKTVGGMTCEAGTYRWMAPEAVIGRENCFAERKKKKNSFVLSIYSLSLSRQFPGDLPISYQLRHVYLQRKESTELEEEVNDVASVTSPYVFVPLATSMVPAPNSADNKAPLLANTNEIVEEENHGKILQPN
ncbi:Serine-threonine/tyrosine-protein kinase catalytic domain [Arabidopsis thaliana x Arabidopsis arenosa]|uniref:Serine-threonine/tyrosine-protein kinase catalytic domain n=1 Tax=Arabidopsis thaliana x Arabidopsis arenosa TaxID=1240361 RepID=A0A8T1ZQ83_9BRAS|nr:Serine-threonine/tyrosine-protein kinase catalytic domain [Arabidopsis thaliana x Arabidopsis arenosa]